MMWQWSGRETFLRAYLVMVLGCIYFLFNFVEGISLTERAGESLLFRGFWLLLYALLIAFVALDIRRFGHLMLRSYLYLAFLALAVVSSLYNNNPAESLIKFTMYIATTAFSAWLVLYCTVDHLVETLFRIGIAVLVVHFALFPFVSSQLDYDALHRLTILGTQAYAGVFGHKNLAGSFFGLMVLLCFVRMMCGPRSQFGWSALVMGCHFVALSLSGAAGPLISMAAAIVVTIGFLMVAIGRRTLASIYFITLCLMGLMLVAVPSDALYSVVGRTEGLTGRTFLWSVWPHFFWQRPWIGYGFSGFFNELANAPSSELTQMAPWNTEFGSFENSYLDALLQFGLLGGGLYLLVVARALWDAITFVFTKEGSYWLAPFAMLVFILITSCNDSSQLLHNYFSCVFVFWCYFGPDAKLVQSPRAFVMLTASRARRSP